MEQDDDDSAVKVTAQCHEEFDHTGAVTKVENLHFIEGILGTGAFATVRLARRKAECCSASGHPHRTVTPINNFGRRGRKLTKSQSVPDEDDDFLNSSIRSLPATSQNAPSNDKNRHPASPSVVGNLGLFIRQRISFDLDDDDDEQLVAVKIFSKSILKRRRTMTRDKSTHRMKVKTALQQVEREIALMKKLSHPNLVPLYEVIDSPHSDMLYMVLEYMPLGEILTYQNDGTFRRKEPKAGCAKFKVQGLVDGHFDEENAALYFVDMLHGLAYLHQHHICHRDLKPENILLDNYGVAKVADFGVSHIFEKESHFGVRRHLSVETDSNDESSGEFSGHQKMEKHPPNILTRSDTDAALAMRGLSHFGMLTRTEGTWCFWSPEMCLGSQKFSGYAADMWAAGVCLYIFVTGKLPFYSEVPTELFEVISEAKINYDELNLSIELVDLLQRCLEKDPDKRAGVGDCLQHPFLTRARERRIRQLSTELEISRKRNTVISEDDIKMAFRIVTGFPVGLMRSASKTIQASTKKLHEAFSSHSSTDSHSHPRRKFFNKQGSSDSGRSSCDLSDEINHQSFGSTLRSKLSFGSVDHPLSGGEAAARQRVFHKQGSSTSTSSFEEENRQGFGNSLLGLMSISSVDQSAGKDSGQHRNKAFEKQTSNGSAASFSYTEEEDGPRESMTNGEVKVQRMISGMTSTCSFDASLDLPKTLSEEDEQNLADETSIGDTAIGDTDDCDVDLKEAARGIKTGKKKRRKEAGCDDTSSSCVVQ